MKVRDIVYISPKYKFLNVDWGNKSTLMEIFRDRIEGFYFVPAESLEKNNFAFALGVLCVTTIDSLARIEFGSTKVKKRFEDWLQLHTEEFKKLDPDNNKQNLAIRFYEEFRNGLVHEGRIKNCGQFNFSIGPLVFVEDGIMVVNPSRLFAKIRDEFYKYIKEIKTNNNSFINFRKNFFSDFNLEVSKIKKVKC
jgi:hypothetical protein